MPMSKETKQNIVFVIILFIACFLIFGGINIYASYVDKKANRDRDKPEKEKFIGRNNFGGKPQLF